MKPLLFFALFLVAMPIAYGAVIFGDIYDLSLDKVTNAVVEINTEPLQKYVARNGTYAFQVPQGRYAITARLFMNGIAESSAQENITLRDEGTYRLDLILFPSLEEENLLLNETGLDVEEPFERARFGLVSVIVLLAITVLAVLYFLIRKKLKTEEKPEKVIEPIKIDEGDDLKKILDIIKKEGGRTTQKEIRKQIPMSEAKISLMIAQLEHEGKVTKIKKGRGNIVVMR